VNGRTGEEERRQMTEDRGRSGETVSGRSGETVRWTSVAREISDSPIIPISDSALCLRLSAWGCGKKNRDIHPLSNMQSKAWTISLADGLWGY
jgi:hypothetical protein